MAEANRDDDSFLARWSRRKHAERRGEAQPAEPPAPPAAPAAATPAPAQPQCAQAPTELPPVDSLQGIASEYKDFMRPEVDAATRSAALKKLFFDPHFNQMDGLDVYIDDYTKYEPLTPSALRLLNQGRYLGLFEEEKKTEPQAPQLAQTAQADGVPSPTAEAPEPPTPEASADKPRDA